MTHVSIIPTHSLAVWLMGLINRLFTLIGLGRYEFIEQIVYFAVVLAVCCALGWTLRVITLRAVQKYVKMRHSDFGAELLQLHTLTKCSHVIPPLVFLGFIPFAFDGNSPLKDIILRATIAYIVVVLAIGINAILVFAFSRYNEKENTKNLPLKGILNVAHGIVWGVVVIIIVSIIVNKSPAALLGGLTAFAAVLMLVFKDSILGLVAGVQMSQNDMLRVGDWIVVPSTPANGVVIDVTLTTVKVQNFDNTIIMVPPYTLVSTSFQNWRGMCDSGVRRVAENIYINPDTIKPPTADALAAICDKYPQVKTFVDSLKEKGATMACEPGVAPLNGTIETNLGIFRAYLVTYLVGSALVDHTKDLMVKIQAMSAEGVPLQLYFFTVTTQWQAYEGMRSAIMEHALAAAADFNLEILSADHLNIDGPAEKS